MGSYSLKGFVRFALFMDPDPIAKFFAFLGWLGFIIVLLSMLSG